jgi:tetratricopeptide (TPR) repeat protein
VRGYVELETLGPVALRGVREPVPVSRILGPGRRRAPLGEAGTVPLTPFVGRDRELAALLDLLARAEDGQGQAAGIVGEPGVGKSRLLLELRRRVAGRDVAYLEGRCLSFGGAIPYLPVLDLLRARCGLGDGDAPEVVAGRVRDALQAAGGAPEPAGAALRLLLGVGAGAEALAGSSPEAVKARTFEALRRVLLRASRPAVLVVEDLHWIDRTSEELLASVAEQLGEAPVLLLATYRPGYRPPWMDRSYATQLPLARLAGPDSLSVVRAILPEAGLADPTARLILDRAEGNPFFLEELARAVGDAGGARAALAVPDTVQGVLAARIDRLPELAKRLLQTASVLGRQFPRRLLEALWTEGDAGPLLRELVRQEFLREGTGSDDPGYTFKHALTQDVALASLLAPRRRDLHRRAAEALVALDPGRERELAPVLAHHYVEAEAWAEAVEHARRAGEAAAAGYANREALERYDQALAAAGRAGLAPAIRSGLLEARAAVHAVLGAFDLARGDLEAALDLATEGDDRVARARILGGLAALWGGHKDYARGLELAREAVRAGEISGEPGVQADALFRLGLMAANLGRLGDSRQALEGALVRFRAAADARGVARTLDVLGMMALLTGDLATSTRHAEEAAGRLAELGDRETEASALVLLAVALAFQGQSEAAEPHLRRALAIAHAIGSPAFEAFCHGLTAEGFEPYGQWGRAWEAAGRGLDIARSIGHLEWMALTLSTRGRIQRSAGDAEGARRTHEEQLAMARELGATLWIADALAELGQDLLAAGALGPAGEHLDRAIETAGEAHKFAIRSLLARAELALRRGEPAAALDAVAAARPILTPFRVYATDAIRVEGEALAASGRPAEAEAALRRARADARAIGAVPLGWRACLGLDRLLRETGRPAEAAAARAEARRLLAAVATGLPDELRRAFEASPPFVGARAAGA